MQQARGNNRKVRRNARARLQTMDTKAEQYLKDIRELQLLEIGGALPPVPDVTWMRTKKDKIYTVQKGVSFTSLSSSSTIDSAASYTFSLSQIPEAASYQNVFDTWRISQVQVRFTPQSIGLNSTSISPLSTAIDYDDSIVLSQASMLEYDTCMTTMTQREHVRTLIPRKAVAEYSGSAFTGYGQAVPGQWTDSNSANTPYYGLKAVIPVSGAAQTYSVFAIITLQFKNTR